MRTIELTEEEKVVVLEALYYTKFHWDWRGIVDKTTTASELIAKLEGKPDGAVADTGMERESGA